MAYLIASPYFERLNNPNENVRVWATRAIVTHHVLNIDAVEREWGWVNDKAKNEHHIYSGKAPGATLRRACRSSWVHGKLRQLVGWPSPGKRETTFWLRLFAVKLPLCAFLLLFARYVRRVTGLQLGARCRRHRDGAGDDAVPVRQHVRRARAGGGGGVQRVHAAG